MQAVDVFEAERRLLGLAYRILGSAVDAEDVVRPRGCGGRQRPTSSARPRG